MTVGYELKKLVCSPFFLFATATALVLNTLTLLLPLWRQESYAAISTIHRQVDGEITDDTREFLRRQAASTGLVHSVYDDLLDEVDAFSAYADTANRWSAAAAENADFFAAHGNCYAARQNALIAQKYADRALPLFADTRGSRAWFAHGMSSLFVVVLLALGLAPLFAGEYASGMAAILHTSVHGRGRTAACKLMAACVLALSLSLLFSAADTAAVAVGYRLHGLSLPLYTLAEYRQTPYVLAVWQAMLWVAVVRAAASVTMGLLMAACGVWTTHPRRAFWLNIAPLAVGVAVGEQVGNPLSCFTPQQWLTDFCTVRLGDYPLSSLSAALVLLVVTAVVATLVAWWGGQRRRSHG